MDHDDDGVGVGLGDADLVPEKEFGQQQLSQLSQLQQQLSDPDHVFNQQRAVVAKLPREELEDRYLRLLEENVVLKKHACKQEDKIKKLATKLIRVLSDKKRLELNSGGGVPGVPGSQPRPPRDIETEELIEDQRHRIRELERQLARLKEKLMVAKQQLIGQAGGKSQMRKPMTSGTTMPRNAGAHPPLPNSARPSSQLGGAGSPSPVPLMSSSGALGGPLGPLLTQQAQHLLEEARNENRLLEENCLTLKEQLNLLEQELEQQREQFRIREANLEEEVQGLKGQVLDGQRHTATENIQLIQLHKDNNIKTSQIQTLRAQVENLEEQLQKVRLDYQAVQSDTKELGLQLQEEQKKNISLSQELTTNTSSRQALLEAEEKSKDLARENSILRESNEKLLDSAYNLERERQFQASENSLKVQIAQLESTLKSDLQDKKLLQDALFHERERYAKLESDFQDLQTRYFSLKENLEGQEEKMQYFAKENAIDMKDLQEALLLLRHKKDSTKSIPSFLDEVESGKDMKAELSEIQVQYVESINELEKTRKLLQVQGEINQEQKNEVTALQGRVSQLKSEYQAQLSEYKKLLDMRASRIQKLEIQLREAAYGNLRKNLARAENESGVVMAKETSVHTSSGQSLFEIHVQRVLLTQETLIALGITEPKMFATWTFYDHDLQYTPMALGPEAAFDSSSYYKIKLDDALLDYLSQNDVLVDIHLVIGNDCKSIAQASIKLAEVLDYPANKLHGSVMIHGASGQSKGSVLGTMDYWFKLHTAATSRIKEWMDHRREVEQMISKAVKKPVLSEVDLLKGENEAMLKEATNQLPEPPKTPPEPVPAPKLPEKSKVLTAKPEQSKAANKVEVTAPEVKKKEKEKLPPPERKTLKAIKILEHPKPSPRKILPKEENLKKPAGKENNKAKKEKEKVIEKESDKDSESQNMYEHNSYDDSLSSESESELVPIKRVDPMPKAATRPVKKSKEISKEEISQPQKMDKKRDSPRKKGKKGKHDEVGKSEEEIETTREVVADEKVDRKGDEKKTPLEATKKEIRKELKKGKGKHEHAKDTTETKKSEGNKEEDVEVKKEEPKATQPTKKLGLLQRLSSKFKSQKEEESKAKENKEHEEIEIENDKEKEQEKDSKPVPKSRSPSKVAKRVNEEYKAKASTPKPKLNPKNEEIDETTTDDDKASSVGDHSSAGSSEEGSSKEDDSSMESGSDDSNNDVYVESSRPSTRASESLSSKPATPKVPRVKKIMSVAGASSTGTDSITQDSEGVVMRKNSPKTRRASVASIDVVIIDVTEFTATNADASFLHDNNIQKLYVEYKFLDLPQDELETPFALPKPKYGEKIVFNFRKVIDVVRGEQLNRRRLLTKMLGSEDPGRSVLVFTVVSEPIDDSEDCEDIGVAEIDLATILRTGKDLEECVIDVYGLDDASIARSGPIGTLMISVHAKEVFKSLRFH